MIYGLTIKRITGHTGSLSMAAEFFLTRTSVILLEIHIEDFGYTLLQIHEFVEVREGNIIEIIKIFIIWVYNIKIKNI